MTQKKKKLKAKKPRRRANASKIFCSTGDDLKRPKEAEQTAAIEIDKDFAISANDDQASDKRYLTRVQILSVHKRWIFSDTFSIERQGWFSTGWKQFRWYWQLAPIAAPRRPRQRASSAARVIPTSAASSSAFSRLIDDACISVIHL